MVPAAAAEAERRAASPFAVVDIVDAWAQRDLQLCVRSRAALAPAALALFDHLAQSAGVVSGNSELPGE
jgi:hypothetical protein